MDAMNKHMHSPQKPRLSLAHPALPLASYTLLNRLLSLSQDLLKLHDQWNIFSHRFFESIQGSMNAQLRSLNHEADCSDEQVTLFLSDVKGAPATSAVATVETTLPSLETKLPSASEAFPSDQSFILFELSSTLNKYSVYLSRFQSIGLPSAESLPFQFTNFFTLSHELHQLWCDMSSELLLFSSIITSLDRMTNRQEAMTLLARLVYRRSAMSLEKDLIDILSLESMMSLK